MDDGIRQANGFLYVIRSYKETLRVLLLKRSNGPNKHRVVTVALHGDADKKKKKRLSDSDHYGRHCARSPGAKYHWAMVPEIVYTRTMPAVITSHSRAREARPA